MRTPRHSALLYRDEKCFIETVSAFIKSGLELDATGFAIVTAQHHQDLSAILVTKGQQDENLIFLDADDCLARFMVAGWPNEAQFMQTMEALIGPASKRGPVRVVGEMVAVLCREGKANAAKRLEELWNAFLNRHNSYLLCAYPLSAMYGEGGDQIRSAVCQLHQQLRIK